METGIHIGASKDAISEARAAINDILSIGKEREITIAALKTLRVICEVKNTTVSNCSFGGMGGGINLSAEREE